MSFKTPYSNMHELNLDWIMKAIKNLFGGTGGQYLRKKSNTQFDYEWHTITPSDIGALPADATIVTSVAGKTGDVTLNSQDVSFDRSENYTEPSIGAELKDIGAELKDIENVVQIPTNLDGSVIKFNATEELPFLKCIVDIEPVQSGSGDPSPDNVRPISGWSEAKVMRTGVNWYPISIGADDWQSFNSGSLSNNNGELIVSMVAQMYSGVYSKVVAQIRKLSEYSVTASYSVYIKASVATEIYVGYQLYGNRKIQLTTEYQRFTFDNFSFGASNSFNIYNGTANAVTVYLKDFQFELGSTTTTYEPYSGNTYTIDLNGTRYGGTLDVLTGVLTVTHANIASYNGETLPGEWISSMDVYAPGTTPTTGAQVVYELASSQTVQLTPQQISSLLGVNNIWADTGNSEITIFKSLKDTLNSL